MEMNWKTSYSMNVVILDFNRAQYNDIALDIQKIWRMSKWENEMKGRAHRWSGRGELCVETSEKEFAIKIRDAVWSANQGFCEVQVLCYGLYPSSVNVFLFSEEDYNEWKKLKK